MTFCNKESYISENNRFNKYEFIFIAILIKEKLNVYFENQCHASTKS